jgi:CHASE3 domain sensor protein
MIPAKKAKRVFFWMGLSVPMLALFAMTWLVHQTGGQFNDSFNWVLKNYKVLEQFELVQSHIVDAESNQRGFLMTGRKEYIDPYQNAMGLVREDLKELKSITRDDPEQQANIAQLEQTINDELVFDPDAVLASGQFQTNASVVMLTAHGKQKIETVRRVLAQARDEQEHMLSRHEQSAESDVISSQVMALVLIAAVAVALIFVVMILFRLEKLQQFVTVCAWTGQVKYQGEWLRLDEYLQKQFGISVSHSLSKEAADKMMREIEDLNRPGAKGPGAPPKS